MGPLQVCHREGHLVECAWLGTGSVVAYSLASRALTRFSTTSFLSRFLNPQRVTMPDVDLDYPDDRRAEMIEYTLQSMALTR